MKTEPNQSLQTISCSVTVAAEPLCVPPHEMSDLKRWAKMKRIFVFIAVGLALGICGFVLLLAYSMRGEPFQTTIGTAYVEWLPASAKDVSLMKRGGFGAAEIIECTIPEADFVELAEKKKWPIKEETNVISRSQIPALFNPDAPVIRRAFQAESHAPNGRGFSVVYDRDLLRMYYYWISR